MTIASDLYITIYYVGVVSSIKMGEGECEMRDAMDKGYTDYGLFCHVFVNHEYIRSRVQHCYLIQS